MKSRIAVFMMAALIWGPVAASADLGFGAEALPFTLKDLDGKIHTLKDYAGKVVVLEWTNPGCPFVRRHVTEGTTAGLAKKYKDVIFLAINSTNAKHGDFLPPEKYKAWLKGKGVTTPILYDETGVVGRAYGAKTTPQIFAIDEKGRVFYAGAMDNRPTADLQTGKEGLVNYVDRALAAHLAGKSPETPQTKPYGCSVKYP